MRANHRRILSRILKAQASLPAPVDNRVRILIPGAELEGRRRITQAEAIAEGMIYIPDADEAMPPVVPIRSGR